MLVGESVAQESGTPTPAGTILAEGLPADAKSVDFGREVRPLLARKCFACHGPGDAQSGLALHNADRALAEADSGAPAIVPGRPDESPLLARVTADDESERMPPEGEPLRPEEVDLLRRWIGEGAKFENHWSYLPVVRREPPAVDDRGWARNDVDRFIFASLAQAGLTPNPEADRRTLLRRLSFDLTGVPPTPEQVEAFVADDSPGAYEALVDRLLASPRYGERWGRHWLDVVRYAETNSYERDGAKPNAWRYRDWVIRSLNDDKPYTDFVIEQLAGDLLPSPTPETLAATGYYRLGVWDDEPADPLQARYDELDSLVATTGQGFLGLTVNCARCHDHKIDPVMQSDYYRMLAFFADVTSYGERGDQKTNSQVEITPPEVRREHEALDGVLAEYDRAIERIEGRGRARLEEEGLADARARRDDRSVRARLPLVLSEREAADLAALRAGRDAVESLVEKLPPREYTLGLARLEDAPRTTHVLFRGNPASPTDEVRPGYPVLFGDADPEPTTREVSVAARGEDGRRRGSVRFWDRLTDRREVKVTRTDARLALARWIASPENPLTARVIVNRVWQHHFGRGIVRSPNNFGLLGTPPTHPELLDYLATRLIDGGWRLKPLHKLIVMSAAYRMSSGFHELAYTKDPLNNLFWRFDSRRLDAEEIRDSLLATHGGLSDRVYGPSFFPEISDEVKAGQSRPGEGWGTSSPEDLARRSVYIHVKRSLVPPELANFDFPETDISCEARFNTTQPGQALSMLNSRFLHGQAEALAAAVRASGATTVDDQARVAVRLAYQREANEGDLEEARALFDRLTGVHGLDAARALRFYCLALYNANEFITVD